jgi:hypothetical protein
MVMQARPATAKAAALKNILLFIFTPSFSQPNTTRARLASATPKVLKAATR